MRPKGRATADMAPQDHRDHCTRRCSRCPKPTFSSPLITSVAERSFSFLDRVKMFVKPMTQPLLRRSGQLQNEIRKTQGLKDFKIAPCVCNDMRPAAAKLLKCQRLTRLLCQPGPSLRVRKQMVETIAQEHRQQIKHDLTIAR